MTCVRAPSPEQLLAVWERGDGQSPAARALLLLGAACDDLDAGALASLPLGRRDALLLELRTRLFGDEVVGVATCAQCAATVEAAFRSTDLLGASGAVEAPAAPEHVLETEGARIRFRLPDSSDLLALSDCGDAESGRSTLLGRCVLDVTGEDGSAGRLSRSMAAQVVAAMAAADPRADLDLAFVCPECGHAWTAAFDVVRFLWQELHVWAQRTLHDVDALARAYHWREADILALSPRRRQAYLELCAS